MSFPAYPSYRDSGVEWLGEVPSYWRSLRLRSIAAVPIVNGVGEASDRDDPDDPRYIRITDIAGPRSLRDDTFRSLPPDIAERATVERGDMLFAAVGATFGKSYLHVDDSRPACFAGYLVRFRSNEHNDPRFVAYWSESACYWSQLHANVIQSTVQNFSASRYRELWLPAPPLSEQVAIAAFLDSETAKIDALIEEQRRLIALLKEKRQAVISHAVTKGLDPHAPMKDSGIEWLGEVPAHWEVKPVKALAALAGRIGFRGYTTADLVAEGEGAITLSPSNIVGGEISYEKCTYISWAKFEESPEIIVEPKDVVLVKTGSTFGRVGFFGAEAVPAATINPQLLLLKRVKCEPEFLFHALNAPHVQALIRVSNTGGTIPTMTQEFVGNLDIPVPPEDEQRSVLQALGDRTAGFRNLIADAESALVLLSERRAALISAAVTGKIDVRGAAATEQEREAA